MKNVLLKVDENKPLKIAIFGGTFDPIHFGHLKVAKVAIQRFKLDRILFIPSGCPPHKIRSSITPFNHRYSMVSLACANNRRFIPSLLEAPKPGNKSCYSVDTVGHVRQNLKSNDDLYFLIGIDAFLDCQTWRDWQKLFKLVRFIVVSRPGFGPIPSKETQEIELAGKGTTLHYLNGISERVSARTIRKAAQGSRSITKWVPDPVAEYIRKQQLYSSKGNLFPK